MSTSFEVQLYVRTPLPTMIDGMGKHVRSLAITAIIGIIAADAGIAATVISALSKG